MLPIPVQNFLPKVFRDNTDETTVALCAYIDALLDGLMTEVINLRYLGDIDRCPAAALNYLGYAVNAGIKTNDSEQTKRAKIRGAIKTHKNRSTWESHCKIIIDAITGYDSAIFEWRDEDDWILCGDGIIEAGTSWATLGGDGVAPLGMLLLGAGTEPAIRGNIYIDLHPGVHTAVLTAAQIAQIVDNIAYDVVPCYMKIYLSYIDTTGALAVYSGGTIG